MFKVTLVHRKENWGKNAIIKRDRYFYIIFSYNKISLFVFKQFVHFFLDAYVCVCVDENRSNARVCGRESRECGLPC